MDQILRLILPLLPPQAAEIIDSLTPLLSLLSSPIQLLWTLYSDPSRILSILASSLGNLYHSFSDLDLFSVSGDRSVLGAIVPLIAGAVGLYFAALSMMSTFKLAYRWMVRLFRWGSILAVIVAVVGLFTGGGRGGVNNDAAGGGGGQNALGSVLGMLTGNNGAGGGNGANNGLYQQAFGLARDYALGNNNNNDFRGQTGPLLSSLWDTFTSAAKNGQEPISSRTRSSRARSAAGAGSKAKKSSDRSYKPANTKNDVDGLTDIAQQFVKEAFKKEGVLAGLFGGGGSGQDQEEEVRAKKAKGRSGW